MPTNDNELIALKNSIFYTNIFLNIIGKSNIVTQDDFEMLYKRLTETMYFMRTIGEIKIAEAIQRCINNIVSNYQTK